MATLHSLDSLIAFARLGCGLDSSYRNKNANRAPVTFIVLSDEHGHMLPGVAFSYFYLRSWILDTDP
jgi:hypothetical protein